MTGKKVKQGTVSYTTSEAMSEEMSELDRSQARGFKPREGRMIIAQHFSAGKQVGRKD
jgi:hypothetical protein